MLNKNTARLLGALIVFFLLLQFYVPSSSVQADVVPKKVLLLFSDNPFLPVNIITEQTITKIFKDSETIPVSLYQEFLEINRFKSESMQSTTRELLKEKYSGLGLDLVMIMDDIAWDFVTQYGDELFPGVPFIFCNITEGKIDIASLKPNITGNFKSLDLKSNIEIILKVQPNLKEIFVITGTSKQDQQYKDMAIKAFAGFEKKVKITFLGDLSINEVKQKLSQLPIKSAVFFVSFNMDGNGEAFIPLEVVSLLSKITKAPIYGMFDTFLGKGILGGNMISYADISKSAVEIGLQVLGGKSPSEIPAVSSKNKNYFDWNEMKRWGIKETNLPPESIVVNKNPGVWDLYKWQIIGIIFFLISETLLIVFLALQLVLKKKARGELKKLNDRLTSIIDGTNAGTWEWNVQTGEILYNERWAQIIGYTLEELSPLNIDTWNRFSHPEDRKKAEILLAQVFNRKLDYYFIEARMKHKDGSWVWVADRGKVISCTAEGKPLLMSGTHTDISNRKRSEEELRKSREEYRMLIENSHDIIFTLDIEGIFTFVSPSWTSLLGHPITRVAGRPFQQFVHPDDIAEIELFLLKILNSTEKTAGTEYRVKHTDGSWRWHFSNGSLIKNADGIIVGFEGVAQDITDRKRVQEALQKSEEQYRLINDASQDSIYSFDLDDHFTSANKHFCESLGLSAHQIIGKNPPELGFEESRCRDLAAIHKKVQHTDKTIIFEGDALMPDGQMYDFEITINPLHDPEGHVKGIAEIARDITERKKAETKINYLSFHNQLTGLFNRHFIEGEIKKLDTEENLPISFIMCDLNGLKLVNDVFGHTEGDQLLVNTSELLKRICRTNDILARWGGDEFVILLPRTSAADSDKIVELIKKESKETGTQKIPVSLSIGAATKTEPGQDMQLILIDAESNMYKNKLVEKESFSSSIIYALEQTLYEKSNETKEHTDRMHDLALKLGKSISLPSSFLDELSLLVSLHDIGKIAIPEKILSKKSGLTEKEWKVIKTHPEIGFNIAQSSPQIAHIANSILACHEHWDGGGYPMGIRGELIPVTARIILIVDAYDVMISGRSYKKPMSSKDAIAELRRCSGTQFDPMLVEKFIEILSGVEVI